MTNLTTPISDEKLANAPTEPSSGEPLELSSIAQVSMIKKNSAVHSGAPSNSGTFLVEEIDRQLRSAVSPLLNALNAQSHRAPDELTDPTCIEATDHALWLARRALALKPDRLHEKLLILGTVRGILWTQNVGMLGILTFEPHFEVKP